ncbi:ribonuclease H2 subunit B [Histomonas meleagridis]|uniref:ribonuclease H2 subunit B n=1 Tax=Histomonas meleagridis TaxID=135588 RepID=UPI00355A227A|nr:ribonuclease H2 subunit B [Histomonas meleagridis]KAH0800243.1 ribonuclease H2 subunit B [Histomonas meleagridis]
MRVAFSPENLIEEAKYYTFHHPRTGKEHTFLVNGSSIYELSIIDRPHSSWFVGEQFVSNGAVLVPLKMHPIFLIIPIASSRGKQMLIADEFFKGTELEPIAEILIPHISTICDSLDMGEGPLYYFSANKTYEFLINKTQLLMNCLSQQNPLEDKFQIEVAYDILRHSIPTDIANNLKNELRKIYPESFITQLVNNVVENEEKKKPKNKKKPQKKSNNKQISDFFKPVKSKK